MQELLSVNDRYHQTLHESQMQRQELVELHSEAQNLRAALAQTEERFENQERDQGADKKTNDTLRAAHELQGARCAAAEAEKGELNQLLEACMGQLTVQQSELEALHRQLEVAEQRSADSWQAGYDEGKAQREAEHKSRMRQAQQNSKASEQSAFDQGRQQGSADQAAVLLREQAQRRLLLHRAEEAKLQHGTLESQLGRERRARSAAQGRLEEVEQRLSSVRWHKGALEGELLATRTAHAQVMV